jgi:CRISPR type III-B/RAMP module-associated protein Cmr5
MKTLEQQLMQCAYEKVVRRQEGSKGAREKYVIWTKSLGAMIQSSGLAQAVAFLKSKDDEEGFKWLLEDLSDPIITGENQNNNLYEIVTHEQTDVYKYMALTRRVMKALVYFKRFAESFLDTKNVNGAKEQTV